MAIRTIFEILIRKKVASNIRFCSCIRCIGFTLLGSCANRFRPAEVVDIVFNYDLNLGFFGVACQRKVLVYRNYMLSQNCKNMLLRVPFDR